LITKYRYYYFIQENRKSNNNNIYSLTEVEDYCNKYPSELVSGKLQGFSPEKISKWSAKMNWKETNTELLFENKLKNE